jgi:hypothetical protein
VSREKILPNIVAGPHNKLSKQSPLEDISHRKDAKYAEVLKVKNNC